LFFLFLPLVDKIPERLSSLLERFFFFLSSQQQAKRKISGKESLERFDGVSKCLLDMTVLGSEENDLLQMLAKLCLLQWATANTIKPK